MVGRRLVLAVLLLLAGCEHDKPVAPPPTQALPTYSAPPVTPGDAPEEVVRAHVRDLVPLLNDFYEREMRRLYGLTWDPPDRYYEYDRTGELTCGTNRLVEDNAYYCPAADYVAYDISWFAGYTRRHPGDATTFLIMAHEWGHAAQQNWLESGGGDVWNPPYRKELGADCLAGAFLADAIEAGTIEEEPGDAEAIFGWLYETGSDSSPWLAPGSHGTKEQRQQAFSDGYAKSVDFCRRTY